MIEKIHFFNGKDDCENFFKRIAYISDYAKSYAKVFRQQAPEVQS